MPVIYGTRPRGDARDPHSAHESETAHVALVCKPDLAWQCVARCITEAWDTPVEIFESAAGWLARPAKRRIVLVILHATGDEPDALCREISLIASRCSGEPIVVIGREGADCVSAAINHGARGYIPHNFAWDVAIEAMRLVRAGGIYIPVTCARDFELPLSLEAKLTTRKALNFCDANMEEREGGEKTPRQPGSMTPPEPEIEPSCSKLTVLAQNFGLTTRQAAVVDALCRGKANKIIAYDLQMRESTVKVHVRNIMKKLGARNRTEVAFIITNMHRQTVNNISPAKGGMRPEGLLGKSLG